MGSSEMLGLIEEQAADPEEKQDLRALHQNLREYFQRQPSLVFKQQLKQKLLQQAAGRRKRRWLRGFLWSAGTIAAALFVLALVNPSSWKLPDFNQPKSSVDTASTEMGGRDLEKAVESTKTVSPETADSLPAAKAPPDTARNAAEDQKEDMFFDIQMTDSGQAENAARLGGNGTGSVEVMRAAPDGQGGGPAVSLKAGTGIQPVNAVIYEEQGRRFSPADAAKLARVFGFSAVNQGNNPYRFERGDNQSVLTIASGISPTEINYQRSLVPSGPGVTVSEAVQTALRLVGQVEYLEGTISGSARADTSGNTCTVIIDRSLEGFRLADRPIKITVDLGSGEITGFNAAASVFIPSSSQPLVSPQEIAVPYGQNLIRLEPVLTNERDKSGSGFTLNPKYLVVHRDASGAVVESLVDAIPKGTR